MDRILIPDIPLRARVGVSEAERAEEQEILVEVELFLDLAPAAAADDFTKTVDYETVCERLAAVARSRPFRLIETIAEEAARALLEIEALDRVRVRVKKPGALRSRGVAYAAVEIERGRGD